MGAAGFTGNTGGMAIASVSRAVSVYSRLLLTVKTRIWESSGIDVSFQGLAAPPSKGHLRIVVGAGDRSPLGDRRGTV